MLEKEIHFKKEINTKRPLLRFSTTNHNKHQKTKSFLYRTFWITNNNYEDLISIEISSTPNFGYSFEIDGGEGRWLFSFWFIFKFYISFYNKILPKWAFVKEYNQFADKDPKPNNNKQLRGKYKTRDKGWIPTADMTVYSFNFHHNSFWWKFWGKSNEWSSDIPKWRDGNLNFEELLKGKPKISTVEKEMPNDYIHMPEGKYRCLVKDITVNWVYPRWFNKSFKRYDFNFGYLKDGNFIETPVIKWGKGENSWDCGMDGTYSISVPTNNKTYEQVINDLKINFIKERKRRGSIDFDELELRDEFIEENLIKRF